MAQQIPAAFDRSNRIIRRREVERGVGVGDTVFFVCAGARPAVNSKPIAQKIPSRMAK